MPNSAPRLSYPDAAPRPATAPRRATAPAPCSLINARAEPEPGVLLEFVELLLDIVLSCQSDLVPQVGADGCWWVLRR